MALVCAPVDVRADSVLGRPSEVEVSVSVSVCACLVHMCACPGVKPDLVPVPPLSRVCKLCMCVRLRER
eukprot:15481972-Alexandrium_andersonii.AAC.1